MMFVSKSFVFLDLNKFYGSCFKTSKNNPVDTETGGCPSKKSAITFETILYHINDKF